MPLLCFDVVVSQEQELKLAADAVLCEVRKKQSDVKRMQDILRSLEKLRKLRKEAASRKCELQFLIQLCGNIAIYVLFLFFVFLTFNLNRLAPMSVEDMADANKSFTTDCVLLMIVKEKAICWPIDPTNSFS